jgi:hypothetical protein
MLIALLSSVVLCGAANDGSCLLRVDQALQAGRADLPAMQAPAEEAAHHLIDGGNLYAAGQASMISELSGRAGGFMMLSGLADKTPEAKDVVLYFQEADEAVPKSILDSGAYVVAFGSHKPEGATPFFANHAAESNVSPTLANAVPGWLFTGELIAALTRQGKTPVVMESIGTYSGITRARKHEEAGMTRFHTDIQVPPVAPGVLGNRYCDTVSAMLKRVEDQDREALNLAGGWCADAKANKKRLIMYSMGHLFPDEVGKTDIGKIFESYVWNAGFRLSPGPDHTYAAGDAVVHIGYQHPPMELLRKATPAGARVAYVSVMADRDFIRTDNAVWIDPMWPWVDACVTLEGYDVPVLASSGIINGAIAWEIYRLTMK